MTDTRIFALDERDDIIITGSYQVSFEGGRLEGCCDYGPAVYDIQSRGSGEWALGIASSPW